jgi:hypothetical protein
MFPLCLTLTRTPKKTYVLKKLFENENRNNR